MIVKRKKYSYNPIVYSVTLCVLVVGLMSGVTGYSLRMASDTGSMDPAIYAYDTMFSVPVHSIDDINIGDIILYERDGISVTHRVVAIDITMGEYVITAKGDACDYADAWLGVDDVVAKVVVVWHVNFLILVLFIVLSPLSLYIFEVDLK